MDNILCLEKDKLEDFINWLEWKIDFQIDNDSFSIIKLSIPRTGDNIGHKNVINFFDYNPDSR